MAFSMREYFTKIVKGSNSEIATDEIVIDELCRKAGSFAMTEEGRNMTLPALCKMFAV